MKPIHLTKYSFFSIKAVLYMLIGLIFCFWASGLLAVKLLGFTPTLGMHNFLLVWNAGFKEVDFIAWFIVAVLVCSLFSLTQSFLYQFIATYVLGIFLAFACVLSFSLCLYGKIHHLALPCWPWDWYHFALLNSQGRTLAHSLQILTAISSLIFMTLYALFFINPRQSKLGNSHFASSFEVYKANLFNPTGIVIAKAYNHILRVQGHEGMLIVAPMGSGKTNSVAIPNLLEWQGSVVVNDLKGELWKKTASFRQKTLKNTCYCWSPSDAAGKNHLYNPFFYVNKDKDFWYQDLQLIANSLMPSTLSEQNFWLQSSRDIFLFLSMYLLETQGDATLEEVYRLAKRADFVAWIGLVIEEGRDIYPAAIIENAAVLLNSDPKTRANILQDFYARITLFGDPIIQRNTRRNDFDIRDLRKQKTSIYIHIPPRDKDRLAPLLTLFWAQLIDNLTIQEPCKKTEPYDVLCILDEFGSLSKIDKLKSGASFVRSYHLILMIIVQYMGQIESVYGKIDARSFLNMKIKLAFALNDIEDAKYFSECLGQTTVRMRSQNVSNHRSGGSVGVNHSEQLRPLRRPEEIMRLPAKTVIVLVEGHYPIKAKKLFYFKERLYKKLLNA